MKIITDSPTAPEVNPAYRLCKWLFGPWPIVMLFLVGTFIFHSWNNGLPYYYEKDAPSKVHQVVTGERNFLHPLLMVNTADVILTLSGVERTSQNAVVAGRFGLALFSSIAVASFTMLGWRIAGRSGAVSVGALLISLPLLFELSHIFKEDPALLAGLALSFLAMHIFWEKQESYQAGWMGAASAIAVSGKYVGVAAVLMASVLLLLLWRRKGNWQRWVSFFVALIVTLGCINYQLVADVEGFLDGFRTETANLTRTDKVDEIPQFGKLAEILHKTLPLGVVIAYMAFILHTAIYRRRDPIRWMLIAYPLIILGVLLFSTRIFTRYFLPILAVINVAAALGVSLFFRELLGRTRLPSWLLLPATLLVVCGIIFRDYRVELTDQVDALVNPTREIFIREAIYKLPKDAVIASDVRVYLLGIDGNIRGDLPISQKVIAVKRIGDMGSIMKLKELGVTHVAVHGVDSRYLFSKVMRKPRRPDIQKEAIRKAAKKKHDLSIYDEIYETAKLIYLIDGHGSAFYAPDLGLYELP